MRRSGRESATGSTTTGELQWATVTRSLKRKEIAAASRAAFVLLRSAPSVFIGQAAKQSRHTVRALARAMLSYVDALLTRQSFDGTGDVLTSSGNGPIPAGPIVKWRRRRSARAPVPPIILLYHRIADVESDPWGLAVSPRNFRDHMELLAEEGSCIPPTDLVQKLASGRLPSGSVCITFDDGYRTTW